MVFPDAQKPDTEEANVMHDDIRTPRLMLPVSQNFRVTIAEWL